MLSESEASAFPTTYDKQILRLRLRMTLCHSLSRGKESLCELIRYSELKILPALR
jgi:hypothetical protein